MLEDKTNIFINKAKLIHGNRFDYTKSNYIGAREKIKITCLIHGDFEQRATNHLNGRGCPSCAGNIVNEKEIIINNFNKIHNNKYNYSQVNYINNHTKIIINCDIHGNFNQRPNDHLSGKGCTKCGLKARTIKRKDTISGFINKANLCHNNMYDYSLVDYSNSGLKVKIICSKHGVFEQIPDNHLSGKGCPFCKESKGEKEISNYLTNKNINFVRQHKFNDCRNINPLPFDFYLPEFKLCIEFNGRQHYEVVSYFGGENGLLETQKRDKIKIDFCKNTDIKLIIIKHNDTINNELDKIFI